MYLVFTDLDGTLLDHATYSWEAAKPALQFLRQQSIPWVIVTSKTRAEVEVLRRALGNEHPFIVENGGAAFFPAGYFTKQNGARRDPYDVMEWGTRYGQLRISLHRAAQSSGCRVRGFGDMTVKEVASLCQLPIAEAARAKQREYDEPFVVLDAERETALATAIQMQGMRWTRGGRFWHILGANDKALAVRMVRERFEKAYGTVVTVGLGDGWNDIPFLNVVDIPVLIRSHHLDELQPRVQSAQVTERPGPSGWNEALLTILGA